jgi:hypothetical protein
VTTEKQTSANKRNATLSTGPRTIAGKINSSTNALRHGLAARPAKDRNRSEEVEKLFRILQAQYQKPQLETLLHEFAEAEIDVLRARITWAFYFNKLAEDEDTYAPKNRTRRAMRLLKPYFHDKIIPAEVMTLFWRLIHPQIPPIPERAAHVIRVGDPKLAKIHRYEDRALGRCRNILRKLQILVGEGM